MQSALAAAIDLDDDMVTQFVEADPSKLAVQGATSFKEVVAVLKSHTAI